MDGKTELHFCPKCDTLLTFTSDEAKVTLKCDNCTYSIPSVSGSISQTTIYSAIQTSKISPATVYDPALRVTCSITCPNEACPTRDESLYGTRTAEGVLVTPEVCVFNNTKENKVNNYVCKVCHNIIIPASV